MSGTVATQIIQKLLRKHPQSVPPDGGFDLDDRNFNRALLQALAADDSCTIIDHHIESPVFRIDDTIFVKHEDLIAYMVIWEESYCAQLQRHIVNQVFLWRRGGMIAAFGTLPARVFWSHLLPRHGCLTADLAQVESAPKFWQERVREALRRRMPAYFIDFSDGQQKKALPDLEAYENTLAAGADRDKKSWHLVVTSSPLV